MSVGGECLRLQPVTLRNPDSVRPWQHVLDPLEGYLTLAEQLCLEGPAFAEAWNFGPGPAAHRPVRWRSFWSASLLLHSLHGRAARSARARLFRLSRWLPRLCRSQVVAQPEPEQDRHSAGRQSARSVSQQGADFDNPVGKNSFSFD